MQNCVEIFIRPVESIKRRRDPRTGRFFGRSELALDEIHKTPVCYAKHNYELFMPVSKSGRRSAVKRLESLDGIGEVIAAVREVPHDDW